MQNITSQEYASMASSEAASQARLAADATSNLHGEVDVLKARVNELERLLDVLATKVFAAP